MKKILIHKSILEEKYTEILEEMAVHEGFSRLVRVMTDGQNPNTPEMFKEHTAQIATPVTLLLECHCYHTVVFGFAEAVERPSDFLTMTQKGGSSFSEA